MALDTAQLESDLSDVFASMTDGDNTVFGNGISNAVVSFVGTGEVTTIDTGTVSGGSFSGAGTGSLTVTASACAGIINSACATMNGMTSGGDNFLAEQIGAGLKKMADDGIVETDVTGMITPSSGSPYSGSGKAKGTITCDNTALISTLKSLFSTMYNNREQEGYDGNSDFASQLANAVKNFFTSGTVETNGQGGLSGSTGSGAIA